jgi:rfaE bifunctional protein nucleotidyltransferase chain/domain
MGLRDKILRPDQLSAWRADLRARGQQLVVTNGCFDILHLGHVTYLEAARSLGDCLLVAVNDDASVRALKGEGRPLNPATDRAAVLAALSMVDAVTIFPEPDAVNLLRTVLPEVYVKGGDYTLDTINQTERRLVEQLGGRVVVLGGVPGRSTSITLNRLRQVTLAGD